MQKQKQIFFYLTALIFRFFLLNLGNILQFTLSISNLLTGKAVPVKDAVEVVDVFCCVEVSITTIVVTTAANTSDPTITSGLILECDQ